MRISECTLNQSQLKTGKYSFFVFFYGQHLAYNIESMNPSCPVSTIQTCSVGVMMWEIFSWHALGP